jgi:hypothetical protein
MTAPVGRRRGRRTTWLLVPAIAALMAYGALAAVLLSNRAPSQSTGPASATVYAAGDLAGDHDGARAVVAMLSRHNFDALLTLGDDAYETGSAAEFAAYYQPTYGAFDDRVRPAPGNHDYVTPGAAGYFDYFKRHSPTFSGAPYYAFSLGGWRIYSLNSEVGDAQPGGAMYEWLRTDLNERPADCILAYWHKPMFTVGRKANDEGGMALIWSLLAAHGADIVLAGHDHNYQRWKPIDGITSFVVGTGGRSHYPISRDDNRVAKADDGHFGALEVALSSKKAIYAFRSADDQVLDRGEVSCSGPVAAAPRPPAPAALHVERSAAGVEHLTWEAPPDTTGITGYAILRGSEVIGYTADTSFDDSSLPAGASVLYSVRTVNVAGLRSASSPPAHSGGEVIGFSGSVWSALDRNPVSPTRDKPQSKLWFADGTWWGILYADGGAENLPPGFYIHRFDAATQAMTNTGVAVDERDRSHADALWDEASQRLYVVSTIDSGGIKLYRYDYAEGAYTTDPGFPIRLTVDGAESATIAKDSDGLLWVTITQAADGSGPCVTDKPCVVRVMHSTSADYRWTAPIRLPVEGTTVAADDLSSVVAYGGSRIGIAWSDQLDGRFRFASHADGDSDSAWTAESLVVSPRVADDHLNLKADGAGRVYLVGRTSLNDPSNAPSGTALVTVWVRETDGVWRSGTAWTVKDDVTRPQIMVDPTSGKVAVVAAAPGDGGAIYAKIAAIDTLAFEPGLGAPLMLGVALNNPTTTKQPVDLASGALVLAGDTGTHTYWHNTVTNAP